MQYINTQTLEFPVSFYELTQRFPNVSLPVGVREFEGYALVEIEPESEYDPDLESLVLKAPELSDDNTWRAGWDVVPHTPEMLEEIRKSKVPAEITRAQGIWALMFAGLWGNVNDYADSLTDPDEKATAWVCLNAVLTWRRESPFLISAATRMGMTDRQLDDLFTMAGQKEF